jgi:ATP-dependent Clp protease protease subunit
MRAEADLLDKIRDSIVVTYQAHSSLDADTISDMMAKETWFNTTEAISNGFATASSEGGQAVSNLSKPWIQNAPKPDQIPQDPKSQTAWRLAINKRRFDLIEK